MGFSISKSIDELDNYDLTTEDGIRSYARTLRDILRTVSFVVESDKEILFEILSNTDPVIPEGKSRLTSIGYRRRVAKRVSAKLGQAAQLAQTGASNAAAMVAAFDSNYLDTSTTDKGRKSGVKFTNNRRRPKKTA